MQDQHSLNQNNNQNKYVDRKRKIEFNQANLSKKEKSKELVEIIEKNPREFRERFVNNPLILLSCSEDYPDETYAYIKMHQDFFITLPWIDKYNIIDLINFARSNKKFFMLVLLPWLKKNRELARYYLEDVPEFKEIMKYDFPKEFNLFMEILTKNLE